MSIVGKVVKYEGDSIFIESHGEAMRKIKLSPNQAAGVVGIGLPHDKEPADLVGEHIRAFVRKKPYSFADNGGKVRSGFNYRMSKLVIL